MIKKIIFVLLLFAITLTSAFSSSLRLDSFTTSPEIINAGDEVDLTLRIQNVVSSSQYSDYSYLLKLELDNNLAKENILILKDEDNLGKLASNEYWNSKFKIKINEGAPSANYELKVKILRYLEGTLISSLDTSIYIDVKGDTFFKLDSEDKSILQGETKVFRTYIENIGGSNVGSVTITFGNTENLKILGTNTFYFNQIENLEKKEFELTLYAKNNIESGIYNFPVNIKYNDGREIKTQDLEAGVLIGGDIDLKISSIQTSPKEIRSGDNYVMINFNLLNLGEEKAKSISANLNSKIFKSSYSNNNNVYIANIDASSFSELKFYLDIPNNISSGVYNLDLDLNYQNTLGEEFNKTLKVPIYIKGKANLEIKSVEAIGKIGETIKVKVEIENTGDQNAEEVDIRLISDSSLPFLIEERSVYLGNIKKNSSYIAIFNIKVLSSAEIKDYNIRAFIRSRGDSETGDNNIYTYNRDIEINIIGKSINKLSLFGIIIALLVLIGIIFKNKISFKSSKKNKK